MMKKTMLTLGLFFAMSFQCTLAHAADGVAPIQSAYTAKLMTEFQDIKNSDNEITSSLKNLYKGEEIEKYNSIKNNVYNHLSDYMKMKYNLYNTYIVNNIKDIPLYSNLPNTTLGYTVYNSKYILIQDNSKYRSVESLLFHELGHALDAYDELDNYDVRQRGKYSSSDEFKKISEEEKGNLNNLTDIYYFTENMREYFAESYAIYIRNPSEMKKVAPKTYAFIDRVSNQKVGFLT